MLNLVQGFLTLFGLFGAFSGDETIIGDEDDNVLIGGRGDDDISGEAGDDLLIGGSGSDTIDGGDDDDTIYGETPFDSDLPGWWFSFEDQDDFLFGGAGDDDIRGGRGRDTVEGGLGADIVRGGGGRDTILLTDGGDDVWTGAFVALNEDLPLSNGTLVSQALDGRTQNHDILIGGGGNDTLVGTDDGDALFLNAPGVPIAGGDDSVTRIRNIEFFELGGGDDVLNLTSSTEEYDEDITAEGGEGDDVIWSSVGDDTLIGGIGRDELSGGAGDDELSANNADGSGDGEDDLFEFGDIADAGTDRITDLEVGVDKIAIVGFNITTIADPDMNIAYDGTDSTISLTDDFATSFIIEGINATTFTDDDFIFLA